MNDKNEIAKRKQIRLENYDYSSHGAYFITICTENRHDYFWAEAMTTTGRPKPPPDNTVGTTIGRPQPPPDNTVGTTIGRSKPPPDNTVGTTIGRPQDIELSPYGKIVDESINNIHHIYQNITIDTYVIMPNHIHMIMFIHPDEFGRAMRAPTISRVVQQMKGYATKRIGKPIWQRSFYDHVIRNQHDYDEIVRYIYENPLRWHFDELYAENTQDIIP